MQEGRPESGGKHELNNWRFEKCMVCKEKQDKYLRLTQAAV